MEGSCHLSFQKTRPSFPHWPMQKQLAASQITMALHFKFAPCKCLKLAEKYITMGADRGSPTQRKRDQGLSCSPSKTTPLSLEVRLASCPESFEKASVTKLSRNCETVCFWFHPVFDNSRSFDDVLEMTSANPFQTQQISACFQYARVWTPLCLRTYNGFEVTLLVRQLIDCRRC